jgi:NhaA family Na+:H+ antiporter
MAEQPEQGASTDDALSISITRRVLPGREAEFEDLLTTATEQASRHDGFLGARVFRPARGSRDYRVVFRFERESDLRRWKASPESQTWHDLAEELLDDVPPVIENISGTSQERTLVMALTPLEGYVRSSVSGIGMLLVGTALALVMANTMFADAYERLWGTHISIGVGRWSIDESLRHWVNDALMALFFFILGLEIKREVLVGELRSRRQAAFPIAAALGGAVVPALLFFVLNLGDSDMRHGWGIPMATDTAFTLGILSLFGGRVRPMLLVFLTAFSIVDDIIAVAVIAVFYTSSIVWPALGAAALLLGLLAVANLAGMHRWPVYAIVGVGVWLAVFESGVHGTLAGVLVAMTVPARSWINPSQFLVRGRALMDDFEAACFMTSSILSNEPQQQATQSLEQLCEDVETPMTHLQHSVTPWVVFGILPLFAFANAGISLTEGLSDALSSTVTWGVVIGLLIGKPVGILLFAWAAVRTGLAIRPGPITWQNVGGVAMLGGIGFTMSLFVTELAFDGGPHAHPARIGILLASVVAGAIGYLALRLTLPPAPDEAPAETPLVAGGAEHVLAPAGGH